MSSHFFHVEGISAAIGILAQAIYAIRWMWHTGRRVEGNFAFINELRTNHLPHIYESLNRNFDCLDKIADRLGVILPPQPMLPPPPSDSSLSEM